MSERVDFLAVIARDAVQAVQWRTSVGQNDLALATESDDARAAVAELIEADRELDSAWGAYGDLSQDELDSQDAIDAAVARIDLAESRRAAALARIGGAS